MADPQEITGGLMVLELELHPADPADELTCLFCWGPKVEWETAIRLKGTTRIVGVHEYCRVRLSRPR